jgi:aspartyl-tRNA(Asn)/glutamyl-tRNA(Gln) amidotransferase subunit A
MFSISPRPTIQEIHKLYEDKKAVPSQVVKFFLNRIASTDRTIQAFYKTCEDFATPIANAQDELLKTKPLEEILKDMPLFGIPFGNKAIIQAEGEVFNAGSKILDGFVAPYSSTAYLNVAKAGAIMIGICQMDAHAMGSSGETSSFATTRNPFDTDRICGGSSSGSAGSVASGQVVFSLGTDTGGSIRQPACFTDTVGLKPTYGLVSRWGTQPMSSSLDQVGAFSNSVEDNIIITQALMGKDVKDQTSIDSSELMVRLTKLLEEKHNRRQQNKISKSLKPLTIGLPKQFYIDGIDPVIKGALTDIIQKLTAIGHTFVELDLPVATEALAIYYMTCGVEVASNFQRIDGVRYAKQPYDDKFPLNKDTEELYFDHRNTFFPQETKRRIMLGGYASSAGYYDAYYNQSQKVRALAIDQFNKAFEKCDLMLVPTSPEFPFKIGEKSSADPIKMYLSDIFTCLINPIKIPGLAVPLGLFDHSDLKVFDDTNGSTLPLAPERHRSVAIIRIKGTNQYVGFQKPSNSNEFYNNPETVYLAGGMIEEGENAIEAGARETVEEIGLQNLKFVQEIATCKKLLQYEQNIAQNIENYVLYEVEAAELDNRIESEADQKGNTVVVVTEQDLRSNNWTQLNWILDILNGKQTTPKTVKLPTGCQLLGKELSEDTLFTLALEIESIVREN